MYNQFFSLNDRVDGDSGAGDLKDFRLDMAGITVDIPQLTARDPDADILVQLMKRHITLLQEEIIELKNEKEKQVTQKIQFFYCIEDDEAAFYLKAPHWVPHKGGARLVGNSPVRDTEIYLEQHDDIILAIYNYYDADFQKQSFKEALDEGRELPPPESARQEVRLLSDDMVQAAEAFRCLHSDFFENFQDICMDKPLQAPFFWWYHFRKHKSQKSLFGRQLELFTVFTDWIEQNFAHLYDNVDEMFSRGMVSNATIEYLIRPGDVLVEKNGDNVIGHVATSLPIGPEGDYFPHLSNIKFPARPKDFSVEIEITNLNVVPLLYASDNGQRFMIDFETYKMLHRKEKGEVYTKLSPLIDDEDQPPPVPEVYLFPTTIHGFDLRHKEWMDLKVDQIEDVQWNKEAFRNLVADEDTKELIQALITNKLEAEKNTDMIEGKGNGLIMLLHGSPGTGKTFTAESVAEIAEKPLYPVTCGDIGTKPEEVEAYLESVFHLGKIWGCVVLLDEAEVFLEQRTLSDLKRNALVSVFLRALEYYEGILILTTNRVGTFDEAFKSRIQLALHYDKFTAPQRKQIWKNFFNRLKSLDEQTIDFDDLGCNLDTLASYEMNGRQIRNSITTARQLAQFKRKLMRFTHLKRAIEVAGKFDTYLLDLKDGVSDEQIAREENIR
ncbi:ATPase family AAA domain-containing protein 3A homolog [Trichoderma asperellum]|uniref:ATPase family AAA domain-containing protein 3A homolog n=1 Tax=Trichoderma asperellum TaxID=101201 RepID=A0A6V8R2A7_TRIAP|nr:ATPase family AAA domain-containing protein 3A homolog [Trichoderma asperellum]